MPSLSPADELASVRAELARLKARERALCDALVAAPDCARIGQWTRAEVGARSLRLFDHRLLPPEIRENPLFWRERQAVEVTCHPLDGALSPMPLVPRSTQGHARALRMQ